ncbi:LysR substrate-binding domain-containing protein [Dongia sp.]|uniref:LysR substrate-binding domain-containing protein n=1 Tax=Dongia sp. TaxID=1977262 RepID=UPI0035AE1DA1
MTFRKLPPLGMLRSFEAAARHISFARAGDELGVTAAAVSQQVKGLEEHLGQMLFLRRPQGLSLTEAGLSYLTVLRDAFDRLGAGTDELFHGRSGSDVSVRVTAGFAHLWLAPRLARFLAAEPTIRLRLLTTLWTPLEIDAEADFEIRCGIGAWPQLTAYPLTRDRLFPVCAPALAEGLQRPLPHEYLGRQRLIHVASFAEGWNDWFRGAGGTAQPGANGVTFDTATLAVDLALAGGGFMLGRSCFVDALLAEGRLVAPCAAGIKSTEAFYLVERAGERLPRPARLFRDWILAEAARQIT